MKLEFQRLVRKFGIVPNPPAQPFRSISVKPSSKWLLLERYLCKSMRIIRTEHHSDSEFSGKTRIVQRIYPLADHLNDYNRPAYLYTKRPTPRCQRCHLSASNSQLPNSPCEFSSSRCWDDFGTCSMVLHKFSV